MFLACCHDGGYATFLGQFVSTGKITLVKNGACHPKLKALGFQVEEFPGLFSEPLVSENVVMSMGKKVFQNPFALQWRLGPVLIDKKSGLRYDKPFSFKPDVVKKMERLGLCFWFYLVGECKGCERIHELERRLTVDEFDALWIVARRGECFTSRRRKTCDDAVCIYGHKL